MSKPSSNWQTNHHIKEAVKALEAARASAVLDGNPALAGVLLALKGLADECDGAPFDGRTVPGMFDPEAQALRRTRFSLGVALENARKRALNPEGE